VQMTMGE